MKFNPLSLFKRFQRSNNTTNHDPDNDTGNKSNETCPESPSGHDFVFQTYYDAYTESDDPVFEDGEAEYTKRKTAMFECTLCGEVDLRKGEETRVSGDEVADKFGNN